MQCQTNLLVLSRSYTITVNIKKHTTVQAVGWEMYILENPSSRLATEITEDDWTRL